ncbi:uncharacterized protein LOC108052105 [Drosophila rhopaloa]|uniref:Uncharacterized protein LOC108052105 n=1 Tax=Drosophila rhopaloa TaxID=1041015 RepID=A0A6P4FHI3_DRORH|nr:uncharacterized protein LOC108052105 [Drosophila rhopaloa]
MKITAIILLANLCYSSSYNLAEENNDLVNAQLQDAVNKYRHLSTGNREMAQWTEELYYNIRKGENFLQPKMQALVNFKAYDKKRQKLEDTITERISKAKTLILMNKGGKRCVKFYQLQQHALEGGYKLSNARKQSIIAENNLECPKKLSEDYDDYDYNFFNY